MKKSLLLTAIMAATALSMSAQDNPRMTTMDLSAKEMAHYMAPAWNLGNTMEGGSNSNNFKNAGINTETSWQSTKTTQAIMDYVAQKGYKSVRIPCAWVMGHISGGTTANPTIDQAWITRVREIIDYCLAANLNVFINDHWDGGWMEHDGFCTASDVESKKETLKNLWTQIANALKDYDERVIFGGLNEPGTGGAGLDKNIGSVLSGTNLANRLLEYEQVFIDAVRATGGNNAKRILVVQGPNTNIDETVNNWDITKLTDSATDRLMVEIHFYDPYQFVMMEEDASWGKMQFYWNNSTGTSVNYTSSTHKGTYADNTVTNQLKKMQTNFVNKGYPVIVGEYGAMWRNLTGMSGESQTKHNESLQYWYKLVTQYTMQYGLIPFVWETNNVKYGGNSSIDRTKPGDGITYILNGITQGAKSGITPYNMIYPTPSSTGIGNITAEATEAGAVYDLSGMKIKDGVTDFPAEALPKGIYIFKGKKYVVK